MTQPLKVRSVTNEQAPLIERGKEKKSPQLQAKDHAGPEFGHWSVYSVLNHIVIKEISGITYSLTHGSTQYM